MQLSRVGLELRHKGFVLRQFAVETSNVVLVGLIRGNPLLVAYPSTEFVGVSFQVLVDECRIETCTALQCSCINVLSPVQNCAAAVIDDVGLSVACLHELVRALGECFDSFFLSVQLRLKIGMVL